MSKSTSEKNAIAILKKDHETVKQLFEQFEDADSSSRQEQIMAEAVNELKIHATLEEEIFYPAIREEVGDELMNEADEEHHVARILIAELDVSTEDEDRRKAKFKVLAESVKHHIKEEEGQMLPQAKALDIDYEELGGRMLERKEELLAGGVPFDDEHEMVSAAGQRDGSGRRSSARPGKAQVSGERTTVANGGKTKARKSSEKKQHHA